MSLPLQEWGIYLTPHDSVANATADLVMMAAWSSALQFIQGEPLPVRILAGDFRPVLMYLQSYYFARDDRVYRALVERLDKHKDAIQSKVGRRLRWQLRVLRTQLEGRARTYRVSLFPRYSLCRHSLFVGPQSKVESLAKELDEGEGI